MKLSTTSALLILSVATAGAQNALDLQSRAQLRRHNLENTQESYSRNLKSVSANKDLPVENNMAKTTMAFVTLADGAGVEELQNEGLQVLTVRGDIAIVKVQYSDVERVAASKHIRTMQLQRPMKVHLNKARAAAGVDAIHNGSNDLPQAYTGKGVVAGIIDQGVDPNHINFLDEDGNNRIGYLSHLRYNAAYTDIAETFYGEDVYGGLPISEFSTDTKTTYHGTHTLGIMAGGYRGNIEVAQDAAEGSSTPSEVVTMENPYVGVATGSKIAVSCGELTDAFIAYGMDYMYGYANYLDMPLVYNLSVGSNVGAHDPNTTMSRFLNEVGKEAIICISAGNEGDLKIALNKTFTEEDNTIKTFIYPFAYQYDSTQEESTLNNNIRYGSIAIYSDDDTPFDLQAIIYNKSRNYRVAKRMPIVGDGVGTYYCSTSDWQMDDSDIIGDATFVKAFDGYVGVGAALDEETGRYYGMVDYYIFDSESNRETGQYLLGFEVTGSAGQRIDCYGDGYTTWMDDYGVEGFDDGSCNGTISDMAVAENLVVVGSYNTRNVYNTLDGGNGTFVGDYYAPTKISGFSSYGTLADGRNLPTVCAPGATIISSMSLPYLKYTTSSYTDEVATRYNDYICSARAEVDGKTHYWKQEMGTSMSTPFVAGSIALWLEADPTLKVDDVKDIISKTSIVDDDVLAGDPVQWGAGKFDALAGLKEVIRRKGSGVNDIIADSADNDRNFFVTNKGYGNLCIYLGNASHIDGKVYDLSGRSVMSFNAEGDETTINTSELTPGVYVLNVNGNHTYKISVK